MKDVLLPWDDAAIQRLLDDDDGEWLLDPNTPQEEIDAELRRQGLDPEKIAAEGVDLARRLSGAKSDA